VLAVQRGQKFERQAFSIRDKEQMRTWVLMKILRVRCSRAEHEGTVLGFFFDLAICIARPCGSLVPSAQLTGKMREVSTTVQSGGSLKVSCWYFGKNVSFCL